MWWLWLQARLVARASASARGGYGAEAGAGEVNGQERVRAECRVYRGDWLWGGGIAGCDGGEYRIVVVGGGELEVDGLVRLFVSGLLALVSACNRQSVRFESTRHQYLAARQT